MDSKTFERLQEFAVSIQARNPETLPSPDGRRQALYNQLARHRQRIAPARIDQACVNQILRQLNA